MANPRSLLRNSVRSYVTKTELALHELRDRILTLTLAPEQPIVIDETARLLGISPIPVREALQLLAAEGLVSIRPHIGVIVAPITRENVVEQFTVLEGLETAACRHAIARLTPATHAGLTATLHQLENTSVTEAPDRWFGLNRAFHLGLAALAGLPRVDAELERAFDHWNRFRRKYFSDAISHRAGEAQTEHWIILEAARAGDATRVEALLRAHYRIALDHYLALLPGEAADGLA
jgi:DNA-binding GntR family transcriptional regulator